MLRFLRMDFGISLKCFFCTPVDLHPQTSDEKNSCFVGHFYDVSTPAGLLLDDHGLNTGGVQLSQNDVSMPVVRFHPRQCW